LSISNPWDQLTLKVFWILIVHPSFPILEEYELATEIIFRKATDLVDVSHRNHPNHLLMAVCSTITLRVGHSLIDINTLVTDVPLPVEIPMSNLLRIWIKENNHV
jgi:hypothetical protein